MERTLKIALSGGPSSGKTTFLALTCIYFKMLGYNVYISEEVASLMINSGMSFRHIKTKESVYAFQKNLLERMLMQENGILTYIKMNTPNEKNVIISDRGALDVKAYMDADEWDKLIGELDLTEEILLSRYDCVIFLDANTEYYTRENNKARTETLEESVVLSEKTKSVWSKHPRFIVSKSCKDFLDKYQFAIGKLNDIFHIDNSCNILLQKNKYLIASDDSFDHGEWLNIQKSFVVNNDPSKYANIRLISIAGTFFILMKEMIDGSYQECIITKEQYEHELTNKIGDTLIIQNSFVNFGGKTIGLEKILNKDLLFVRSVDKLTEEEMTLIGVIKDISHDSKFSSYGIASGLASETSIFVASSVASFVASSVASSVVTH